MATKVQSRNDTTAKRLMSRAKKNGVRKPREISKSSVDDRSSTVDDRSSKLREFLDWAVELGRQIPEEELAGIPTDLAKNHEHYLYGHSKQSE